MVLEFIVFGLPIAVATVKMPQSQALPYRGFRRIPRRCVSLWRNYRCCSHASLFVTVSRRDVAPYLGFSLPILMGICSSIPMNVTRTRVVLVTGFKYDGRPDGLIPFGLSFYNHSFSCYRLHPEGL